MFLGTQPLGSAFPCTSSGRPGQWSCHFVVLTAGKEHRSHASYCSWLAGRGDLVCFCRASCGVCLGTTDEVELVWELCLWVGGVCSWTQPRLGLSDSWLKTWVFLWKTLENFLICYLRQQWYYWLYRCLFFFCVCINLGVDSQTIHIKFLWIKAQDLCHTEGKTLCFGCVTLCGKAS